MLTSDCREHADKAHPGAVLTSVGASRSVLYGEFVVVLVAFGVEVRFY